MQGRMSRGAPRHGTALLAGLLRCRRCGRRLHVTYSGANGKVRRYGCRGAMVNHGTGSCLSFGGLAIERAVEDALFAVVAPGAIDAALAATATEDAQRRTAHTRRARTRAAALRRGARQAPVRCRRSDASLGRCRAGATLECRTRCRGGAGAARGRTDDGRGSAVRRRRRTARLGGGPAARLARSPERCAPQEADRADAHRRTARGRES